MVDIPTLPQKAYEYRSSAAMQKAFVTQARQHLESRYKIDDHYLLLVNYFFFYMYLCTTT